MNKVIILGKLGADPELAYTTSGQASCKLSIATNERWTDKQGNKQEKTEWHRVVVWGKQAENCNSYLHKGRMALVEGKIQTRSWEGKDGKKNYTTEIVAQNVQFINGGSDNSSPQDNDLMRSVEQAKKAFNVKADPQFAADEIPF